MGVREMAKAGAATPVAVNLRALVEAAYLVAGATEAERQMFDFALTSLRVTLMQGFKEHQAAMPSSALVVERLQDLLLAAEIDVDQGAADDG